MTRAIALRPFLAAAAVFTLSACHLTEPSPSAATEDSLGVDADVSIAVELDRLSAFPAEPALDSPEYLVVTPSSKAITAYFGTEVAMAPAYQALGKEVRMQIVTDEQTMVELAGDVGLTTVRFSLEEVEVPAGTVGSVTITAGGDVIGNTGRALVFPPPGDANGDGAFDSSDLVLVNQAGKYETGEPAGFSEGDWNGDGVFASDDLVLAYEHGGYEQGSLLDLPHAPEVRSKESHTYLEDSLDPLPEEDEDPCRVVCALVASEHQPDRAWNVTHNSSPSCWNDDDCTWWSGEPEDTNACIAPDDAPAEQKTISGWNDGTHYQFNSCGLPEDYITAYDVPVQETSHSAALCRQSLNVKLVCDRIDCEKSARTCEFRSKSATKAWISGSWERSRWNLANGAIIDDGSMQPTVEARTLVQLPGVGASPIDASLRYSPAGLSAVTSGENGGVVPTAGDAECDALAAAAGVQGEIFVRCFTKVGASYGVIPHWSWECQIGGQITGSVNATLDLLKQCLQLDQEPTGRKVTVVLGEDESASKIGYQLDMGAAGPNERTLGPLFLESTLDVRAMSEALHWQNPLNGNIHSFGQASSVEGQARIEASTWIEAAGDDAHCQLDAAPLFAKPALKTKILAADRLDLACDDRSSMLLHGD